MKERLFLRDQFQPGPSGPFGGQRRKASAVVDIPIAINTDAHGAGELPLIHCGIDQRGARALKNLPF